MKELKNFIKNNVLSEFPDSENTVTIDPNDYVFDEKLSYYNHHFYRNTKTNKMLIEVFEDDECEVRYYDYNEQRKQEIYIGYRSNGDEFFPFEKRNFPEHMIPFKISTREVS